MTRPIFRSPSPGRTALVVALTVGFVFPASAAIAETAPSPRTAGLQGVSAPVGCGVWVSPGEDAAAVVAGQPEGASICFRAGVHRLTSRLRPRAGQQLVGEPGAILRGSKVVTGWQRDGDRWYVDGQTQRLEVHGENRCRSGFELCDRAENVFIDGGWLRQVASREEVAADTFFFDYDRDRIWIGADPGGRLVEATVTAFAIRSDADRVTVRGLTIEQFGNRAQHGAVQVEGSDWLVEHNVVRLNHGIGIRTLGSHIQRAVIRHNLVTHQGQMGIGGHGTDLLIENNEIAYNNQAGFRDRWEAGGTKWVRTVRLVVRGNHVHHNRGPGLWTDIDNLHTLYEHNLSEHNEREGIFHEISYDAVIRNNTIRNNGSTDPNWGYGAGILIAHSPNVTVHHNTVAGNAYGIIGVQQNRGSGAHGPYELENLHVHDNTITMTTGWTGLLQDIGDRSYFTNRNNRFQHNHYALSAADAKHFAWDNRLFAAEEWVAAGNDREGSFFMVGTGEALITDTAASIGMRARAREACAPVHCPW